VSSSSALDIPHESDLPVINLFKRRVVSTTITTAAVRHLRRVDGPSVE